MDLQFKCRQCMDRVCKRCYDEPYKMCLVCNAKLMEKFPTATWTRGPHGEHVPGPAAEAKAAAPAPSVFQRSNPGDMRPDPKAAHGDADDWAADRPRQGKGRGGGGYSRTPPPQSGKGRGKKGGKGGKKGGGKGQQK